MLVLTHDFLESGDMESLEEAIWLAAETLQVVLTWSLFRGAKRKVSLRKLTSPPTGPSGEEDGIVFTEYLEYR